MHPAFGEAFDLYQKIKMLFWAIKRHQFNTQVYIAPHLGIMHSFRLIFTPPSELGLNVTALRRPSLMSQAPPRRRSIFLIYVPWRPVFFFHGLPPANECCLMRVHSPAWQERACPCNLWAPGHSAFTRCTLSKQKVWDCINKYELDDSSQLSIIK